MKKLLCSFLALAVLLSGGAAFAATGDVLWSDNFNDRSTLTDSDHNWICQKQTAADPDPSIGAGPMGDTDQLCVTFSTHDTKTFFGAGDTSWTDYSFESDVYFDTLATVDFFGLYVRSSNTENMASLRSYGQTMYFIQVDGNRTTWNFYKADDGTLQQLTNGAGQIDLGKTYNFQVQVYGGTVTFRIDGTEVIKYTDSDPIPAGAIGYRVWDAKSTDTAAKVYFDNIKVKEFDGSYGGGGAPAATEGLTIGSTPVLNGNFAEAGLISTTDWTAASTYTVGPNGASTLTYDSEWLLSKASYGVGVYKYDMLVASSLKAPGNGAGHILGFFTAPGGSPYYSVYFIKTGGEYYLRLLGGGQGHCSNTDRDVTGHWPPNGQTLTLWIEVRAGKIIVYKGDTAATATEIARWDTATDTDEKTLAFLNSITEASEGKAGIRFGMNTFIKSIEFYEFENTTPMNLTSCSLADGATGVSVNPDIRYEFDKTVYSGQKNNITVIDLDNGGAVVDYARVGFTENTVSVSFDKELEYSHRYNITVSGALSGKGGFTLQTPISRSFTTAARPYAIGTAVKSASGDNTRVTVDIANSKGVQKSATLLMAAYTVNDNINTLRKVVYTPVTLLPGTNSCYIDGSTADFASGTVKLLLWNSIDGLIPLAEVKDVQ